MSNEYQQAIEKNNKAIKAFSAAQKAYRSGPIDDQEFLTQSKLYKFAMAEFDTAFAKEQDNQPLTNRTNLWDRKQLKADYVQTLKNSYYYLVDHYSMKLGSAEQIAAQLIRNTIRKTDRNFLG